MILSRKCQQECAFSGCWDHTHPASFPRFSAFWSPREGLLIIFLVPPVTGNLEEQSRDCATRALLLSGRVLSPGNLLLNPSFLIRSFSHVVSSLLKMLQCLHPLLNSLNMISSTASNSLSSNCLFLLCCLLHKGFLLLFARKQFLSPFHLLNSSLYDCR